MGPPLPRNTSTKAAPDSEEQFVLTPQKIEKGLLVFCKFSSFKIYAVKNGVPTTTDGDFEARCSKPHARG